MNRLSLRFLLVAFLFSRADASWSAPRGVAAYTVSVTPGIHKLHVQLLADAGNDRTLKVSIPVWTPGYYQILNFQNDLSNLHAFDAGNHELAVKRSDDHSWDITRGEGTVRLEYDTAAEDAGFGFFRSHVDDNTAYVNGASALVYLVEGKQLPASLKLKLPQGWKSACPADPAGEDCYRARGYDELIDSPVQMGKFDRLDFTAKGIPFSAVLVGDYKGDRKTLTDTLTRVSEAGLGIFPLQPFRRYMFLFHFAVGSFSGGLEHHNSTVLNVPAVSQNSHPYAELVAHEFFHAWNVKRLHPEVLGPFDYTKKVRTGALWFAEGVTDYYACILPRIAGITSESGFLESMAGRISELQATPARLTVSAEEASRKAWEGGSMGFGGLSYYTKGALLGLLFDIRIRAESKNARSLDDVMRRLDEKFGSKGLGYDEDAILRTINEVAGADLTPLYDLLVRRPEEIPWNDILGEAGLRYERPTESTPFLGVEIGRGADQAVRIATIVPGTAADSAGLRAKDEILTVDGASVNADSFHASIAGLKAGRKTLLGIRRGEKKLAVTVTLGSRESQSPRIVRVDDASPLARLIRDGLLRKARTASVK